MPLQITDLTASLNVTNKVDLGINLPASMNILSPDNFNAIQETTYNASTSFTIYDSLGEYHIVTAYFIKTADNTWAVFYQTVDNQGYTLPIDIVEKINNKFESTVQPQQH